MGLQIGDRVRYVGLTVIKAPKGSEGVIRRMGPEPQDGIVVEFPTGEEVCWAAELERVEVERPEPTQAERIADRVAELNRKGRLNKVEREELAILTYSGPRARRLPPSDEVPF